MNFEKPEEYFLINERKGLTPIKINIFDVIKKTYKLYNTPYVLPDFTKIDGVKLPRDEQVFTYPEYPVKLSHLEEKVNQKLKNKVRGDEITPQKVLIEIKKEIINNHKEYRSELEWIKTQWYRRLFGYWFMNNGIPTYIDGWHYSYLTSFELDVGKPFYKDTTRRNYLFDRFIYTNTETFAKLDKNGNAIPEDDGGYKMKDTGHRTFIGTVTPKGRRRGSTYEKVSKGIDEITIKTGSGLSMGIISFDANNALSQYQEKVLPAWKKKPFYFKPLWYGLSEPQRQLLFKSPQNIFGEMELETSIDPADTAQASYYDGKKTHYILRDEGGKSVIANVYSDHEKLKPCLVQGSEIHGFIDYPSTVEDFLEGGGENYYELCKNSDFYKRNPDTGQTLTGLCMYFQSSVEDLEGFIDKHGMGVVGTPTKEQAAFIKRKIGAERYLISQGEEILKEKTPKAQENYRAYRRKFPIEYDDCWLSNSGSIGFNSIKMNDRLAEFRHMDAPPVKKVNLYWKTSIREGVVKWEEDINGKFEFSWLPKEGQGNNKKMTRLFNPMKQDMCNTFSPVNPTIVVGGDSFDYTTYSEKELRTKTNSLSDGGISGFRTRDLVVDPDTKIEDDWDTYNFIVTYRHRPADIRVYHNDLLMLCILLNAYYYPESNKKDAIQFFIENGYMGYLLYDIDPMTGQFKSTPGCFLSGGGNEKDRNFKLYGDWVEHHVHKCKHEALIKESVAIKSMKALTNFDTLASAMMAIRGAQHPFFSVRKDEDEEEDGKIIPVTDFYHRF
jgi:hypothetical protein